MNSFYRIHLSEAQVSALECAGLEFGEEPSPVEKAWTSRVLLEFDGSEREALFQELNEMSNAECATGDRFEAQKDRESAKYARRASRALGTLAGKVLRIGR